MVRLPLTVLLMLSAGAHAGEVVVGANGREFHERFEFRGNHAATIASGTASTVWWDESSWDVHGDSSYTAVTDQGGGITNRFHVDIHRSPSLDPRDGRLDNSVLAIGGDGGPGVGVMHLDFQDILDARLRNPLLISAAQPARVRFYASSFNTTGHWWEIAITPADRVIGGEHTGVPGQGDAGLLAPYSGSTERQPGPGHSPAEDSINLVMFGATDVPCTSGWYVRSAVTRSVAGVTTQYVNPVGAINELMPSDPSLSETLIHWQLEFRTDGIVLSADPDEDGTFVVVEQWGLTIPWSEVHLHLLGVAYQADHHPQAPCYLGHIRELRWRNVRAWPVKYAATDVFPKNEGIDQVPTTTGWRAYDLRDIQRFGAAINGAPQPNLTGFGVAHAGRYCNDPGFPCFGNVGQAALSVAIPTRPELQAVAARFVYDTKDSTSTDARAQLAINGQSVGQLSGHDGVPSADWQDWVRRSRSFDPAWLSANTTAQLTLDPGLYLDRMEIEVGYAAIGNVDGLFADGFETYLVRAALKSTRRAGLGAALVPRQRFGGLVPGRPSAHCGEP